MLRGCRIAAIPQLLIIVTTILHCSYAGVDKSFLKFTKEKKILNPLESNFCCNFSMTGMQLYKITSFKDLETPDLESG